MEEIPPVINSSNSISNDSLLVEFPYWQPILAVILSTSTISLCGIILFHILVLVALLRTKKKSFKPLDVIHLSILVSSILEDVLRIILDILYLPSVLQHCVCPIVLGTIITVVSIYFIVYRPVAFATLAVFQYFVISGKKKVINVKAACGMIALSVGISLIFVASTVRLVHESNDRVYCYESYCPNGRSESAFSDFIKLFTILILGSFFPSLIVVFIMSTWSWLIFKKYYTGGDDQLNLRMLSLPVVMPLALIGSTILEGTVILIIAEIFIRLPLGVYFPYWLETAQAVVLISSKFFTRLTFPLLLIYTHTHIREAFKQLLRRLRGNNRIAPSGD